MKLSKREQRPQKTSYEGYLEEIRLEAERVPRAHSKFRKHEQGTQASRKE